MTALEHDKSILTLSAGAIGLLITLLTTIGISTAQELILYIFAIICFIASLISILFIFKTNKVHLEEIINGIQKDNDPCLAKLDLLAILSFGLGIIITAIIGISVAAQSLNTKDKSMTTKSNTTQSTQPTLIIESFNGIAKIQPSGDASKSFNGAANLQPQPATTTPAAPSVTPTNSTTNKADNAK